MNKKDTFEEKLNNLESIVKKLEMAEVPLNDAIHLFETGTKLADELEKEIKSAELKIKKATGETFEKN